ncbi:MAG: chemotaxis protein CheX [Candidatus Caldatribacterium sp.]|nr:chemotaxis protein CheX [Candidatus Caldatribacterium sp.]
MERNQSNEIVEAFVDAAREVSAQILGVEIEKRQEEARNSLIAFDGVVAIVGFSGALSGRLLLGIPETLSVALFCSMGGETQPSPEEKLLTASEFGNLVAGHALTRINNRFQGYNLRPSPPSSFLGKHIVFFNLGMMGSCVTLSTSYGEITMDIALKEEQ